MAFSRTMPDRQIGDGYGGIFATRRRRRYLNGNHMLRKGYISETHPISNDRWQTVANAFVACNQPMTVTPENLTRATAHSTRLRILMLLTDESEQCVCDITSALELPQPKISRHLAILRETGVLLDRRAGQWIHYRLHPDIPAWALDALKAIARGCIGKAPFEDDRQRMVQSGQRPSGTCG